jgi:hypothetical protein
MEIPPISRLYLTGAFLTTAACAVDLISPFSLYFSWELVYQGQIWRLLTSYLFFGVFSVDFLFHMYFLVRFPTKSSPCAPLATHIFLFKGPIQSLTRRRRLPWAPCPLYLDAFVWNSKYFYYGFVLPSQFPRECVDVYDGIRLGSQK